jgi:hypothetical protein
MLHPNFAEFLFRDCLKITNRPHRGLLREVGTRLKTLFRSLECHQIHTLKSPLAIFQTVSLRDSVNRPLGFASHGDDNFSSSVSFFQITDGLGDLAQRVRPVDDRCDLAGFDELPQD